MVVMDRSLYVFGGMKTNNEYTKTVEKLSNDNGQWEVSANKLKGNFVGFAGVFQQDYQLPGRYSEGGTV